MNLQHSAGLSTGTVMAAVQSLSLTGAFPVTTFSPMPLKKALTSPSVLRISIQNVSLGSAACQGSLTSGPMSSSQGQIPKRKGVTLNWPPVTATYAKPSPLILSRTAVPNTVCGYAWSVLR